MLLHHMSAYGRRTSCQSMCKLRLADISKLDFNLRRYMNLDDIVRLWYKTQMGDMRECMKNQFIFADIMWKLYEKLEEKE